MSINQYLKWNRFDLTYSIHSYNSKLDIQKQIEVIAWSFNLWAEVTKFKFTKLSDGRAADIEIHWTEDITDVGIANPPPGRNGQKPEDGNVFLNLNFDWTFEEQTETGPPYDYYTLCAHELGHSIGLGQQILNPETLMSNHFGISFRRTSENDVNCYKQLYFDEACQEQCFFFIDS